MFNRSWCLRTLLLSLSCGTLASLGACQNHKNHKSDVDAFNWDNNLDPLVTQTGVPTPTKDTAPGIDSKFCQGARPGSCLSLILRVPTADLIQDLGLSSLAVASTSKNMRTRLDEACKTAWLEYRQKGMYDTLHPLRAKFLRNVEKMRCIYLFMGEEYVQEDTKLSDNEIALSTRLTKFEIGGEETAANIRTLGVQVKKTFVQTSFRSSFIYSGKAVSTVDVGWQMAQGFPVAPKSYQKNIERDFSWKVDVDALKANLDKIATDGPAVQASITSFVTQAKAAVANVSAIGAAGAVAQPLGASLLMVGMGYNAYRTVCGEALDKCKVSSTKTSSTGTISEDLVDLVPSSDTNELYRLAVIRSIQGMLDELVMGMDAKQISQKFLIK